MSGRYLQTEQREHTENNNKISDKLKFKRTFNVWFFALLFSNLWCVDCKCHTKCSDHFHLTLCGVRVRTIALVHAVFIIFWRCSRTSLVDLNKNVKFIIIWNGNDDKTATVDATIWSNANNFYVLKTGREGRPHQWHTGTASVCDCVRRECL